MFGAREDSRVAFDGEDPGPAVGEGEGDGVASYAAEEVD